MKGLIKMKNKKKLLKVSIPKCKFCGEQYVKKTFTIAGKNKEFFEANCTCEEENEKRIQKLAICMEQDKKRIEKINDIKECGLGKRFKNKNFANFDENKNPKAYKICFEYARNIEDRLRDGRGLFLSGNVGVGKTHLIAGIVDLTARLIESKILRQHSKIIVYATAIDLLAELKKSYMNEETEDIIKSYEEAELLIIDDLGVEKGSDWVNEVFFKIIDHRYTEMKPTIFASNLRNDEIKAKLGERIMSRIYETCIGVEFTGRDYRVLKFQENCRKNKKNINFYLEKEK
jgi:DNA replication protein DnaC